MEDSHTISPKNPSLAVGTKADTKVLSNFDTCRKSARQAPKKEYVRCKLIRGHKRAIRQIFSSTIPKTTIHKFNPADFNAQRLWASIKQIVEHNRETFSGISKTESGPITDGRAKRTQDSIKNCEKSFNAAFCKSYFSQPHVRESFTQYINLIFVDFDPSKLSEKFEFFCCRNDKHSVECLEKWAELQRYLKSDMLRELDCEPVEASNVYVTLPSFDSFTNFEMNEFVESNFIITH